MSNYFHLVQTLTPGKPARFSANGKRISRDKYEEIVTHARMYGAHECFYTKSWPTNEGGIKRKNYSTARYN